MFDPEHLTNEDGVIARIEPAPFRRGTAIVVMTTLGALLVYLGLAGSGGNLGAAAFLVLTGGFALYMTQKLRTASKIALVLTVDGLFDENGREVVRLDNIKAVERGTFAFKPSHGFLIRLKARQGAGFAPGIWWRLGKKVGIGGVTPGPQAKFVAEVLAKMIAPDVE